MKKAVTVVLTLALLFTALFSLTTSAEVDPHVAAPSYSGDGYVSNYSYKATYGTPVVDGIKDSLYDSSEKMIADRASSSKSGAAYTTYAEYWMAFNRTTLFIYCHVHDETPVNNSSKPFDTSGDSVDMYIDLVDGFGTSTPDAGGGPNAGAYSGMFRVDPFLTAEENLTRLYAKTNFGVVANYNGSSGTTGVDPSGEKKVQLAIGRDGDAKGYWFEMAFDFTEAYQKILATKLDAGQSPTLGFSVMINDVITAGTRDSYIVSKNSRNWINNAAALFSKGMERVGEVVLDVTNYKPVEALGAQMKSDKSAVRVVFGVDSLNYQNVGFEVAQGDVRVEKTANTVYSSVNGYKADGTEVTYTAKGLKTGYLITLKVTGFAADGTFTVKPYVTGADSAKIYGRTVSVTVTGGVLTAVAYAD